MLITDATNLPRIMQCNGSILLQADPVFAERDATTREEGNAAHWLASVVFNGQHTAIEMVDRKAPNGVYITAEMVEHVTEYVGELTASFSRPDGSLNGKMEWSYSIQGDNWAINGRADHVAFCNVPNRTANSILYIDDFKYGYTPVEPEMNWTLISHAVGFCLQERVTPELIVFTIHQPRGQHHAGRMREWSISYEQLLALFDRMNATLRDPSNVLQTGPSCYHCPSFISCPARQAAELNGIETSHIAYNTEIDNFDLSERLQQILRAEELLKQSKKAYEELAIHRMKAGQVIKNFMLENGLTNRMWKEVVTPDLIKVLTGKDIAKRDLPTPKQAELAGVPPEIVAMFAERKPTGTKLVRADANKKAQKMFGKKS